MITFAELERYAHISFGRKFGGWWYVENHSHIAFGDTLELAWERFKIVAEKKETR